MVFFAEFVSAQNSGASLLFLSSSTRARFASTSKILLDLFEFLGNRYQAFACIVHEL